MLREAAQIGSGDTNAGYYVSCFWNHRRYQLFPFHKGEGPLDWNYRQAKSRNGKQLIFKDLGENLFWNIYLHPHFKHILKPCKKYLKPVPMQPPAQCQCCTPHLLHQPFQSSSVLALFISSNQESHWMSCSSANIP